MSVLKIIGGKELDNRIETKLSPDSHSPSSRILELFSTDTKYNEVLLLGSAKSARLISTRLDVLLMEELAFWARTKTSNFTSKYGNTRVVSLLLGSTWIEYRLVFLVLSRTTTT